jgi:hypothetical protein
MPGKKLRIAQYKLEGFDAVRIGFDKLQSEPPYKFKAQLAGNVLYLDRDKFGVKKPMPPELVSEVRAQCIAPILQPESGAKVADRPEERLPKNVRQLTPIKTYELDAGLIAGEPLFNDKDEAVKTATDDRELLIETERAALQSAFKAAMKDSGKVNAYLQLTKDLSEKKSRIKIYMPLIGQQYAELLVKINVDGNVNLARQIFNTFVESLHPAATGMRDKDLAYNISVMASQGFILYGDQRDPELPKIIFGKLLEKDYDIKTHKNRTLIYNLACYYALTQDKQNMLAAAQEARKRGTPTEQFMKDADFIHYLRDADFLRVVK